MISINKIIIGLFLLALIVSCKQNTPEIKTVNIESAKNLDPNATYAKTEFTIEGMTCAVGCAATIQKKIGNMEGVKTSIVDFDKKLAMVEYDVAKVSPKSIKETVTKVGDMYKVGTMKTVKEFSIKQ